jgi:hypothetical protein
MVRVAEVLSYLSGVECLIVLRPETYLAIKWYFGIEMELNHKNYWSFLQEGYL